MDVDWSKPVEAFYEKGWREVSAVMRNHDGSVYETRQFCHVVAFSAGGFVSVPTGNIRNKPKGLVLYALVKPDGKYQSTMSNEDNAYGFAEIYGFNVVKMVECVE
jgi:hypothetical protein